MRAWRKGWGLEGGLGFGVWGFGVWGFGFGVRSLGFRVRVRFKVRLLID